MKPFLASVAIFACFIVGLIIQGQAPALAQRGTVAGRVVSSTGVPAAGVRVVAIAAGTEPAGTQFVAGLAQTDNAGRYALEDIPPGRYWIGAGALQSLVFYPGVPTSSKATVLTVNAGSTIAGMDFTIVRTAFNVTGRALLDDGALVSGRLILSSGGRQANTPIAADGSFEFRNLAVGVYEVSLQLQPARGGRGNTTLSGIPNVLEIVDRDIQFELRVPKNIGPNTLQRALEALQQAASSLRAATTENKGGHRELAIAEADKALVTMKAAIQFASDHPESKTESPISSEIRIDFNPVDGPNQHPNLQAALVAFREAFEALEQSPGGSLGGNRSGVYTQIAASVAEINLGMLVARDVPGGGRGGRGGRGAVASNNVPVSVPSSEPALARTLVALRAAAQSLQAASSDNKGGNREKAITEVDRALADIVAAIQFAAEHPAGAADPPPPAPGRPDFDPPLNLNGQHPNMRAALNALGAAFDELSRAPGGALGGNRSKVYDGIAAAVKSVQAGIQVAIQGGGVRSIPNQGFVR